MNAVVDFASFTREIEADAPQWMVAVIEQALGHLRQGGLGLGALERRDTLAAEAVLLDHGPRGVRALWLDELAALLTKARRGSPVGGVVPQAEAADSGATLQLTLKDEQEVDEDVELSHLIQNLELRAEAALRDLRALCSALRGWSEVQADAHPLHPQALAESLGHVTRQLPLTPVARLVLLRVLVTAASGVLPPVYQRHLRHLKAAGVQPARFQVRLTPAALPRHGAGAEAADASHGAAAAPVATEAAPSAASHVQAVLQQLLAASGREGGEGGAAPSSQAVGAWMTNIMQAVQQEAAAAPRMRQVIDQLADPGMRLARVEPALWQQPDHVWWRLLDRVLALCAVLGAEQGGAQEQLAQRCEAAVTRLCTEQPINSALCQAVLDEIDTATSTVVHDDDAARAATSGLSGADVSAVVREQMTQQLRHTAAPGSIRRFLLGPWLKVVAAVLDPAHLDTVAAQRYTAWVDELLATLGRDSSPQQIDALLAVAREGLGVVAMAPAQRDAWLSDLAARLQESAVTGAAPAAPWKHEDLPTVPIALHGSLRAARAKRDRVAWLSGLRAGDICRMFLDTAWRTVQLVAVPQARAKGDGLYVFQSRGPQGQYRLTLGALERLRDEGLATTVESGAFIARALDTMAAQLSDR